MSDIRVYVDRGKVEEAVFKRYKSYGKRAINSMNYYKILQAIQGVNGFPMNPKEVYKVAAKIRDEAIERYRTLNPDGSRSEYYRGRRDAAREILELLKSQRSHHKKDIEAQSEVNDYEQL